MTKKPSFKRARPATTSSQQLFQWVTEIVELTEQFPEYRRIGTEGDQACRDWLMQTLKAQGITDLAQQTYPIETRHYHEWALTVDGMDIECFFMNGCAFTDKQGLRGELVYVGDRINPDQDLRGKLVVYDLKNGPAMKGQALSHIADYLYDPDDLLTQSSIGGTGGPAPGNFPAPYYEAVRQGAIGFIAVFRHRDSDAFKFYADPTAMVQTQIPGVFVSGSTGETLINHINQASSPLQGLLKVRGETSESTSGNIVAHVQGQKSDAMLVNTHHDAGWSGAVQDASGVAVVLGLAAFYSRFPSNYIQKDLYFVFNGSHYSWNYPFGANKFAQMNADVMNRLVLCFGVEHIGKRFIGKHGQLVDTGEVEPRFLWAPRNRQLYEAAVSAIEKNDLHSTIIPKPGAIPVYGETQSYFLKGIPTFSIMSMPEYLFFSDDTLDKVAVDELHKVMLTILDIMDSAMYLPGTWLNLIDK